ncbi:phage portal protein [Streptomyces sp. NPDC004732]|uniref:phage portal protein n=1 Tax=Streptomyces sp. NPDC004732 TaxID=3154290 RepID=UPI0033A302B1
METADTRIKALRARVKHGLQRLDTDNERLEIVDRYVRGFQKSPYLPRKANPEFRELVRRSTHNILPLLIDAPVNALAVEGYHRPGKKGAPAEWKMWQENRLDMRQTYVHRTAIESGQAYVSVLPSAKDPSKPEVRAHHPMQMWAAYEDPLFDQFPMYAVWVEREGGASETNPLRVRYYDDKAVYELLIGSEVKVVKKTVHNLGVCPIVRFAPKLDLRGRAVGMVETLIPLQDKLNQMWLSLLIAQHYTGHAIRTATGLAPMEKVDEYGMPVLDEDGQPVYISPVLDPSTMLISPNPETQFGQLPSAPTGDFQHAIELVTRHMCALTETPPHYLMSGAMVQLSADALAAAESAFTRKCDEYRQAFGEGWESVFRLCALIAGDRKGFEAPDVQVQWADKGNRSMAQTVDAALKLTQMGVPTDVVLKFIPGFTQTDIADVKDRLEDQDGINGMADKFAARLAGDVKSPKDASVERSKEKELEQAA